MKERDLEEALAHEHQEEAHQRHHCFHAAHHISETDSSPSQVDRPLRRSGRGFCLRPEEELTQRHEHEQHSHYEERPKVAFRFEKFAPYERSYSSP